MRRDKVFGKFVVEVAGSQVVCLRTYFAIRMPRNPSKSSEELLTAAAIIPGAELAVRNRREFVANFDASLAEGGIFIPTRRPADEGALVTVSVRVGRRQPYVFIHGRVAWRRTGKHLEKIRAGIGIEFLPGERVKCDYILALATGETPRSRRRHERRQVDVPVSWHVEGDETAAGTSGVLRDIGPGGAFISTPNLAPNDSDVILQLAPPGAQIAMAFSARVAWIVPRGENAGFGVQWRSRDVGGGKRIRELVRRLTV